MSGLDYQCLDRTPLAMEIRISKSDTFGNGIRISRLDAFRNQDWIPLAIGIGYLD